MISDIPATGAGTVVDAGDAGDTEDEAPAPTRHRRGGAPGPGSTTFGQRDQGWKEWIRPLLVVAVLGLTLRLAMVLVVHPTCSFDVDKWAQGSVTAADFDALKANPDGCFQVGGDALYLFLQGRMLSEGKGYASPVFFVITGEVSPGAGKPPAMPALIAGMHLVGLKTPTDVRVAAALLGAAAVLLIGHTAGKLAGKRAAIIAAIIAALYPMLWINDWKMLNDGPMILASAFVLYAAFTFWGRPRPRTAALLGLSLILATFTRSEALSMLVFLVVPLCWSLRRFSPSARLRLGAVVWLTFAAIYMPWVTYNLARFHQPSLLGGSVGSTSINSSCDSAWYGTNTGYLDFECIDLLSQLRAAQLLDKNRPPSDESDLDLAFRQQASDYISANKARAPIVLAARVGRMWDVYKPLQNLDYNINLEGRGRVDSTLGLISYFALLPWAIAGLVILYRRRITIIPMVAFAASLTLTAAITFGITRFRVPIEVSICLLAGVAIDAGLRRYRDPGRAEAGIGADEHGAVPMPTIGADLRAIRVRPPRWSPRTWALVIVPCVLVVGVLVWSSKVEAPARAATVNPTDPNGDPTVSGGTTLPTDPVAAACVIIKDKRLADGKLYERLSPATVGGVIASFKRVEAVAPPEVVKDAQTIRELLAKAQAAGFTQGKLLDKLSAEDRTAIGTAGIGFIGFAQKQCR